MIEPILNRWRGTGVIFSISNYGITGVNIYALYLGLLFGSITTWYIGVLTAICFRLGETFGWGKWEGHLCYPTRKPQYENNEGKSFPYIHYLANFIIKEKEDYKTYCEVALGIRGLIWGLALYVPLVFFGYIYLYDYLIVSIIYGACFPLACYLSTILTLNYSNRYISIVGNGETEEFYYGVVHFMCNLYLVGVICWLK